MFASVDDEVREGFKTVEAEDQHVNLLIWTSNITCL